MLSPLLVDEKSTPIGAREEQAPQMARVHRNREKFTFSSSVLFVLPPQKRREQRKRTELFSPVAPSMFFLIILHLVPSRTVEASLGIFFCLADRCCTINSICGRTRTMNPIYFHRVVLFFPIRVYGKYNRRATYREMLVPLQCRLTTTNMFLP